MSDRKLNIDFGLVFKLALWSLIVGAVLYWLELSPKDIYGWSADKIAGLWDWIVGDAVQYILLGATIVVPLYFLMRLKDRMGRKG